MSVRGEGAGLSEDAGTGVVREEVRDSSSVETRGRSRAVSDAAQ